MDITLDKILDKAYEETSLKEILDAPPSALAGLSERHDAVFADLKIKTIADLANNKYFKIAAALQEIKDLEG